MDKRIVLGLITATALLGGCKPPEDQQKAANTFREAMVTNPVSLDPALVQDTDTHSLAMQCYEGLVETDENNQIKPALAERWEISNGGKTYTIYLKKGVKFHTGKELTAEDVKWTIDRNTGPKIKSATADTYLDDIVGAMERIKGEGENAPKEVTGVRVKDKYTVVFELVKPRPYFLEKLTYPVSYPLSKGEAPESEITQPSQAVGTGPYILKEFVKDQGAKLVANKNYRGGSPKITEMLMPVIKDATTRLNKYKAGELDMLALERQDVLSVQKDPALKEQLKFVPRASLYYLSLNENANPAFKNKTVRQAIAMAINKEHIVKNTLGGINVVANTIIPPGVPGHRTTSVAPKYNPEMAKQYLAKAGFGPGGKKIEFHIAIRAARPDLKVVAERITVDLMQVGIQAKVKELEWGQFLSAWNKNELDAPHMKWQNDYLDPQNSISIFFAKNGPTNHNGYDNSKVNELIAKADRLLNQDERIKLYKEAEDIILDEVAEVPLYFVKDAFLIRPEVKGLRFNYLTTLPRNTVYKEKG
jgi:oligopeptide transport system substrate-binding protein